MTFVVVIKKEGSGEPSRIHRVKCLQKFGHKLAAQHRVRELVTWTDEMIDTIAKRYGELSATELSRLFSNATGQSVTKNSVIGKARDLGLCKARGTK